jgi:4-hydroxy-tetrahydrodipicolinate synthase
MTTFPSGVISAPLTPLNSDLSIDLDHMIDHCNWLLAQGAAGLAILGTTGEANSFSLKERMDFLESIAKSSLPTEKLLVGTGNCSTPETVELTRHALNLEMSNILMLPPFYYKQIDDNGLTAYFDRVIDGISADHLRIYLYHIPQMSGIGFSVPFVKQIVEKHPKTIVGMKDSGGDFLHMKNICTSIPGFRLYAGTEKYLLDVMRIGGVGCISATANVTVALAAQVYDKWQTEEADELQEYLTQIRSSFEGLPFTAVLKQYLADVRKDSRWFNIRPPNYLIDPALLVELKNKLAKLSFTI